jgi:hypothetical protein
LEFLNKKIKYVISKSSLTFPLLFIFLTARASDLPRFSVFDKLGCKVQSNYIFLDDKKKSAFEKKHDIEISSKIIKRFDINCAETYSKAYLLNDRVRTHYQTLLIWIKDSKVAAVETIYFKEPKEYKAPSKWMKTIELKHIKDLYQVDALSGATLTRQSTLKLVKKSLLFEQL